MTFRAEQDRRRLVSLLWLYFALLIVEGALRKWVFPQWSDGLLIVRDPVAVAILYCANRDGYLPSDSLMRSLGWLLVGFLILGVVQLVVYGVPGVVLLFGLRTYFLHPPLIFVMARVLHARDLRRLMLVTLIVTVPIALLMVWQFRAGPFDWINRGAGEGRLQIESALGRVRPAGPFSFISGPVFYYSLTLAYLVGSDFSRSLVSPAIQVCGWGALLVASAVSGSRSLVFGLIPVLVLAGIATVRGTNLPVERFVRAAVIATATIMTLWGWTIVQEGLVVFDARMEAAGGIQNLWDRSIESYAFTLSAWTDAPWLGLGIGLGTNGASALLGGSGFRFGEDEWRRILFETGPLLGTLYLGWRVCLTLRLLRLTLRAISFGDVLPIAIIGACLTNLLLGQWGQPTSQGFAIWMGGLGLATCRVAAAAHVRFPTAPMSWSHVALKVRNRGALIRPCLPHVWRISLGG